MRPWNAEWSDGDILTVLWRFRVEQHTAAQLALSFGVTRSAILGLVHRVVKAGAAVDLDGLGDGVILGLLAAVRGATMSAAEAGASHGLSGNAVLGVVHRLMAEVAGPGEAKRPENRNGGMDRHWYRDGLAKRRAAA